MTSGGGGQFWYFPYGFLYKKKSTVGGRKIFNCCPIPEKIFNKYTPGSGIGSTNASVRRAKLRLATSCDYKC